MLEMGLTVSVRGWYRKYNTREQRIRVVPENYPPSFVGKSSCETAYFPVYFPLLKKSEIFFTNIRIFSTDRRLNLIFNFHK